MSPQSEIDMATLEELQATTDAEFVAEIVDAFCEDTPRYIAELRESLTKQDLDTFRRAAHSIKSSSKIVGALNLASQAAELEQMARGRHTRGRRWRRLKAWPPATNPFSKHSRKVTHG